VIDFFEIKGKYRNKETTAVVVMHLWDDSEGTPFCTMAAAYHRSQADTPYDYQRGCSMAYKRLSRGNSCTIPAYDLFEHNFYVALSWPFDYRPSWVAETRWQPIQPSYAVRSIPAASGE
jgi:hypothetical protein